MLIFSFKNNFARKIILVFDSRIKKLIFGEIFFFQIKARKLSLKKTIMVLV